MPRPPSVPAVFALPLALLLALAGCGTRPGRIEGRAVAAGEGVAGATVDVYLGGGGAWGR